MTKNKPSIFLNLFKFILLMIIGIVLTVVLLLFDVPGPIVYVIIMAIYLSVFTLRPMYIIYKSTSLQTIDRYIINNQRKPLFAYAYAVAYGSEAEIEGALKQILNKYKQQKIQHIYGANLALFQKDDRRLLEYALAMKDQNYNAYYSGIAYAMNGNLEKADECLINLKTSWMIHSLKAFIALKRGNKNDYLDGMNHSIASTAGIQRYVSHHMLKRFENI